MPASPPPSTALPASGDIASGCGPASSESDASRRRRRRRRAVRAARIGRARRRPRRRRPSAPRRPAVGRSVGAAVASVGAASQRPIVVGHRRADLLARAAVAAGAAAAGHAARRRRVAHAARLSAAAVGVGEAAAAAVGQALAARQLGPALRVVRGAGDALLALLLGRVADQRRVAVGVEEALHAVPVALPAAEIAVRSGARQSASLWHIAPEHWPTPFMMSRQLWPVGQPLRGAGPQPGTQKPAHAAADQARVGGAAGTIVGRARAAADAEVRDADRLHAAAQGGVGRACTRCRRRAAGPTAGRPGAPDRGSSARRRWCRRRRCASPSRRPG